MLYAHHPSSDKHFIWMVIELGLPMLESSTKIWKFHALTDSEHKFYKVRIKNWLPIEFELGSTWLGTHTQYHRFKTRPVEVPLLGNRSSTNNGGVSKKSTLSLHTKLRYVACDKTEGKQLNP